MKSEDAHTRGREAFQRQSWADAYALLSAADSESMLDAEDLELLARAAYLTGREIECTELWTRSHRGYKDRGELRRAANCAFWLGLVLFNQGNSAQGSGWINRARRLVEECGEECEEQGFLLIPQALQHLRQGEAEKANQLFARAIEFGYRFDNPDLQTLGRLGSGQSLIHQQLISEGIPLLDEAMVAVVSDELSPIVAGIVYCAVIDTCRKIYDLRRAREWTEALSRWCDSQPDLIPYRGQCLVRRAEIMQLNGEWLEAMEEVQRACDIAPQSSPPATGEAYYRQAELHRLLGEFTKAEQLYKQAYKRGRNPQPGLAMLRLVQGRKEAAVTAIRQTEKEQKDPLRRARLLPSYVQIMLSVGEIQEAKSAAEELSELADDFGSTFLKALADRSVGHTLFAEGDYDRALDKVHQACSVFNDIEATYETGKTHMLLGLIYEKLSDGDAAKMELEKAHGIFQQLGATPVLNKVESYLQAYDLDDRHGLTPRECEVLRLLATGKTNKNIAGELFISERTVDRHVSNILGKLNVPSRSAATAYAYEHNLL